jgi:hypothetical protein
MRKILSFRFSWANGVSEKVHIVMNAFMYLMDDHLLKFYIFISSFGIHITFMYYIDVAY